MDFGITLNKIPTKRYLVLFKKEPGTFFCSHEGGNDKKIKRIQDIIQSK